MTLKYADRVRETSLSTGAGNITLAGAAASYRLINTVFNNDLDATGLPFDYTISHISNNTFEVGTGKLVTSTLMQRTTVKINSDENTSFINFASGGLIITVTPGRDTLANLEVEDLITDLISESTTDAGVTIDGVLLKDGQLAIDAINEKTLNAGVTIEGVLLKDSALDSGSITSGFGNIDIGSSTIDSGDLAVAGDAIITSTATSTNAAEIIANSLIGGSGLKIITANSGFNNTNGLLQVVVDDPSATGHGIVSKMDGTGNSGRFIHGSGSDAVFIQDRNNGSAFSIDATSGQTSANVSALNSSTTTGNLNLWTAPSLTSGNFLSCVDAGQVMRIEDDGSLANATGTYATICDRKTKDNITAGVREYSDDFLQIQWHRYQRKADLEKEAAGGPAAPWLLGPIADEVEQIFPSCVKDNLDVEQVVVGKRPVLRIKQIQETVEIPVCDEVVIPEVTDESGEIITERKVELVQRIHTISKTIKKAEGVQLIDGAWVRTIIPQHEELVTEGVTKTNLVFKKDGSPSLINVLDLDEEGNEQFDDTGEDIIENQPVLDDDGNQTITQSVKSSILNGDINSIVLQEQIRELRALKAELKAAGVI